MLNKIDPSDFELTGEFKISIVPPTNIYFLGHNILDFIAKSSDGFHWEEVEPLEDCVLCKTDENFKFNELTLRIIEKFNIPLKLYIADGDKICCKYDENTGNSDLIGQLNKIKIEKQ